MNEIPVFKKTRIAPTPSGFLHLGNILLFAITAAIAKKTKAKIVLRIDDNDPERINKLYVQDIFDTLNFLEIPWDEGPKNLREFEQEYSQLHRMDIYGKALQQLRDSGYVFACTCSRSQLLALSADSAYTGTCMEKNLSMDAKNTAWRINTDDRNISFKNLNGTHTNTILPVIINDFIVRKKDGLPGYQLTSLIDDIYFGVDLVIRGEDLLPSGLAQLYLSQLLGLDTFRQATFYHHPLMLAPDGRKLSKSDGADSVHYLRKEHKKPADIYTMIAGMLGYKITVRDWESLTELMGIIIAS